MNTSPLKLRIDYFRDGLVEEYHEGLVYFYNSDKYGSTKNDNIPYFLRSCSKPIQASLLIDNDINFLPEELALCSGSHAGEESHVKIARNILKKLNLKENNLKCGIHEPLSKTMQKEMLLKNEKPSAIHNNCSGKHLGFLALCLKNNWDTQNYYELEHPLQKIVLEKIYNLCEIPPATKYPITTDGCGVPSPSLPLYNLLIGFKNLSKEYPKLVKAIIDNPYIYGGEDRLDTEIIQNSKGILAKVGAGGLCVVYNLNSDESFVVKMNDASMPARRYAVLELINKLGWAEIPFDKNTKTISGKIVGEVRVKQI